MAVINILPNGSTSGNPNFAGNPNPPKRSDTTGWNFQVSRRLRKWLFSIPVDSLTGHGVAFTLTVRDCPQSSDDWSDIRILLVKRLMRSGCIRLQWLTEWQERGVPHLHGVAYFDNPVKPGFIISHWIELAQSKYGSSTRGQHSRPINNVLGWLDYLAKHSTRSAMHYQRSPENIPSGWIKTGRMWGYSGFWDSREPMSFVICQKGFYAYRRILNNLRLSQVRDRSRACSQRASISHLGYAEAMEINKLGYSLSEDNLKSICEHVDNVNSYKRSLSELSKTRSSFRDTDKDISRCKGTSNWIDQDTTIKIILFLGACGYRVHQSE